MTEIDWELVGRYAAGECTLEERGEVDRRLAASPAYRAALDAVRQVAVQAGRPIPLDAPAARLPQLHAKIAARTARTARTFRMPESARRRIWPAALKIAAAVLLAVGASLVGYHILGAPAVPVATVPSTIHTVTTPRGQRMALRLSDGTQVVLAPASTLRFSNAYGAPDRTVELDGEAAFTVTHDEARPFTVRTSRLVAQDLGTHFVVRAYAEDSVAQVVVAEGEVAVRPASSASESVAADSMLLTPGDGARVTAAGHLTAMRDVSLDSYFGWTEARLVFRGTPLDEAVRQIERWYDVDVRLLSPEVERRGFTAVFRADESASDVLHTIATLLQLKVTQTGPRTYTLRRS